MYKFVVHHHVDNKCSIFQNSAGSFLSNAGHICGTVVCIKYVVVFQTEITVMKNVLTDSCSMETALRHCPYLQCFKNYNEKITLMIKFFALYFKQRKQTYKN